MTVFQDLRHAVRTLGRAPVLVLTAVASLGLAIGANTAVFSFVNAIQFKPLPFEDPAALVDIEETSATELCDACAVGTSFQTFLDWRARATSFAALGGYEEQGYVVAGGSGPERARGAEVTAGLFRLLGIAPATGREIVTADEQPGAPPVVVLSDRMWRVRFAADASVLARTLRINGVEHAIVGVMPPGFAYPDRSSFWRPISPERKQAARSDRSLGVVGRLRRGASVDVAAAEMKVIGRAIAAEQPATHARWTTRVRLLNSALREETVPVTMVLLGAVAFVLLIACANVSNLLLVRASERQRELAIRAALGAGRAEIVRLVVAEAATLAAAGGLLGLLIALWASGAVTAALGVEAPYWIQFGLDWTVFLFCAAVTIVVSLGVGAVPALHATRVDPQATLKEEGTASASRRGRRVASALVVGQLALALLLLAGAGLLIKTVATRFDTDQGYDTSRVLAGDLSLADRRYEDLGQVRAFADRLLEQVRRLPGVRAGVSRTIFFRGFGGQPRRVAVEGLDDVPDDASPSFYRAVTPGYFAMMGMPMSAGREFTDRDAAGVVLIDRSMADRLWPQGSAIGHRIRFGDRPWLTIVGVVGDRRRARGAPMERPLAYVPFAAEPGREISIVLSADNVTALIPEVRAAVAAVDRDQPIEGLQTMEAARRAWAQPARFVALLMTSLSLTAVALAAIGLYGVMAFAVRRRLREIGIRLALGGTPRDISWMVVGGAVWMIVVGVALGLAGAFACTRMLSGILFGTSPTDPVVFAAVTLALAGVSLLASWIPARRASRVDPLLVLKNAL
jgi:putative ABC transport system permease protein